MGEHWAPTLEELADMEKEAANAEVKIKRASKGEAPERRSRSKQKQKDARRRSREKMEAAIVKRVEELSVQYKTELFEYWSSRDTSPRGFFRIPASVWREGCEIILDDAMPWVRLQDVMQVVEEDGLVPWVSFLRRHRVAYEAGYGVHVAGWERDVWGKLKDTLLKAELPIREAFAAIDATNDGLVSSVEFGRLLENCGVGIPAMQARSLLRAVAANPRDSHGGAPRAQLWDFLERFQHALPVATQSGPEAAWVVPKLKLLAAAVLEDAKQAHAEDDDAEWPVSKLLAAWFEDVDLSNNGYLELKELVAGLSRLAPSLEQKGCPSDPESLERLAKYCDVDNSGLVNYFELLNAMTWGESVGPEMTADILETYHAAIYFNRNTIRLAMGRFDPTRTGKVSRENFSTGLMAVANGLNNANSLSKFQVEAIAAALPQNEEGLIDYERWLNSFHIVDTAAAA